jgi:hypothetical protein
MKAEPDPCNQHKKDADCYGKTTGHEVHQWGLSGDAWCHKCWQKWSMNTIIETLLALSEESK